MQVSTRNSLTNLQQASATVLGGTELVSPRSCAELSLLCFCLFVCLLVCFCFARPQIKHSFHWLIVLKLTCASLLIPTLGDCSCQWTLGYGEMLSPCPAVSPTGAVVQSCMFRLPLYGMAPGCPLSLPWIPAMLSAICFHLAPATSVTLSLGQPWHQELVNPLLTVSWCYPVLFGAWLQFSVISLLCCGTCATFHDSSATFCHSLVSFLLSNSGFLLGLTTALGLHGKQQMHNAFSVSAGCEVILCVFFNCTALSTKQNGICTKV